jgi:hypothetical protein
MSTKKTIAGALGLASAAVAIAMPASAVQPPPNDHFRHAKVLRTADPVNSPCYAHKYGDNEGATRQAGERGFHGDRRAQKTVWFKWTAPYTCSGPVTIDTYGSDFDTLLSVYRTKKLRHLGRHVVAENDDAGGTFQSAVSFNTSPGATYRIQVDGFGGSEGFLSVEAYQ